MGKSLGDVSLGTVLGQIMALSTRFSISVQPQFNLLQKTMMMAEGVARQLNPEADMWGLARPLAGDWMQGQANFSRRAETFAEGVCADGALPPFWHGWKPNRQNLPSPPQPNFPCFCPVWLLALR